MPSSGVKKCALRSEEHTSELQSHDNLLCRLLLEKKKRPSNLERSTGMAWDGTARWVRAVEWDRAPYPYRVCMAPSSFGSTAKDATAFFFNDPEAPEISSFSQQNAFPT